MTDPLPPSLPPSLPPTPFIAPSGCLQKPPDPPELPRGTNPGAPGGFERPQEATRRHQETPRRGSQRHPGEDPGGHQSHMRPLSGTQESPERHGVVKNEARESDTRVRESDARVPETRKERGPEEGGGGGEGDAPHSPPAPAITSQPGVIAQ